MGIRLIAAIWAARLTGRFSRLTGRQGVTLAGEVALKLCPTLCEDLSAQIKEKIFVTCGTNGKTTTNNLLCAALEAEGKKVVCNSTGSNMLHGVAAALALKASLLGRLDADYACLEVDEASSRHVFPRIHPSCMILTNLFRDQLDRYGEIDITMDILRGQMEENPGMTVIVNADDALSAYLAMESKNPMVTFGIGDRVVKGEVSEIREGRFCKRCGQKLSYAFYHYSQLGSYTCPGCGFHRPVLDYDAQNVKLGEGIAFQVENRNLRSGYRGFYNVYNILAAYAGLRTAGLGADHFQNMLDAFHPENGRMEEFHMQGSKVVLNLAKNPAGFNQNIAALLADPAPKDLIIAINDNAQDGIDVSWLWDVDFDVLANDSIRSIVVSGLRCHDMQLRLKYVDIPSCLEPDMEKALTKSLKEGTGNLYVLVNYTALYHTHLLLKKMEGRLQ